MATHVWMPPQEWNKLRRLVLSDALTEFLVPSLTRELRQTLLAESREWALQAVGDKLWDYATQAPVKARLLHIPSDEPSSADTVS